ncbi:MAG: PH domain-containing protein [Thermoplasmata archaeon]
MRSRVARRLRNALRRIPGPWRPKYDLLRNEEIRAELQPHPLSFLSFHAPFLYLFALGLGMGYLFNAVSGWVSFEDFLGYIPGIVAVRFVIWTVALLVFGIAVSVLTIRWSVFGTYVVLIALALYITLQTPEVGANPFFLPLFSVVLALGGLAMIDLYRRTHTYVITDLRLILRAGILTKSERSILFENVTDLETKQGILARIFRYGHIIPVTASGLGTGAEEAFAGGGVGAQNAQGNVGGGLFAGGARGVRVARATSYAKLHGVFPFRQVKMLLHHLLQEHSTIYYAKEQRDILRDMRELMAAREEMDTILVE